MSLALPASAAPGFTPRRARIDPAFIREDAEGQRAIDFLVSDMHCAACLSTVERTARAVPGVTHARANLTNRRLSVTLDPSGEPENVLAALHGAGREARPFDWQRAGGKESAEGAELMRCLGVSGFASAQVMILSVAVWSGADAATRDFFHWIAAFIAIPAVIYAGRPFYRSAWRALRHGRTNMDVPISIGVLAATALSFYETMHSGPHAWFDGAISLLFFLLVGRALDNRMRDAARSSAARLLSLAPDAATLVLPDGETEILSLSSIREGDRLRVLPGERVPIDGTVVLGASDIDRSLLTGESIPEPAAQGTLVHAGAMNLTGLIEIEAKTRANDTLLAGIVRLMEAVERPDGRFVRLADRASRLYAPFVHTLALLSFLGWMAVGAGAHTAINVAVAVLIITCPCALGLAVPAVQITAAGRFLKRGIIMKDGAGLEKLSEVDTVVFDKTGTLTKGQPRLLNIPLAADPAFALAASLAQASAHPLSRALARSAEDCGVAPAAITERTEEPGFGVSGVYEGCPVRLGRPEWVGGGEREGETGETEVWLRLGEDAPVRFRFADALRTDAAETIAGLKALGLDVRLLSGDAPAAVERVARETGIPGSVAGCLPGGKVEALEALAREGRKVLMVGDGINDAPALAAAHVSMSPAGGSDIAQAAADLVFTGETLAPVLDAIVTSHASRRKIMQNFALSIGYNVFAVPIAMLGYATPLIAAVFMSASSVIVIANALTLGFAIRGKRPSRARILRAMPA